MQIVEGKLHRIVFSVTTKGIQMKHFLALNVQTFLSNSVHVRLELPIAKENPMVRWGEQKTLIRVKNVFKNSLAFMHCKNTGIVNMDIR